MIHIYDVIMMKVENYELPVQIHELQVQSTSYQFKFTIYKTKSTSEKLNFMILQCQMKIFQQLSRSFSLQKQPVVQSKADIVLFGFSLILLPGIFILCFILHYHLFFVKNSFFEILYFSEYVIRMFLCVFWLRNMPSMQYVRNQGNGEVPSKMFTDAYRGRGVSRFMCTYTRTLPLFMFLSYGVLFYLFNLTFPSFKKVVFVRNGYFSPMRSIFVVMK